MSKREELTPLEKMFEPRKYSDIELQDFHQKIQRFWEEPRTLENGQIARKFNHEELHTAFGACRKVKHGGKYVYLYNDRYRDFNILWGAYEDYRRRMDWGAEQRDLKLAENVPF